ncbi:osmotically inducible protein C [Nitrosomonas sp. PY1]|uniref:OsmC family protein n=1 Tax=Nitrosomonas sp. PY1 TaxID=1803906 RepID=UPI001FC7FA18|nr:OsmC family protein [Nitrosomonas sp. PY1]GKS70260.1 osmotically inducible protein C [Nitrosomonas sp. PY1]
MINLATNIVVNGLDSNRMRAVLDSIKADSQGDIANPRFQTTVAWDSGYHSTARVTDGQSVISDEPKRYGGEEVGVTPEDLLLAAIGSCLVNTYIAALSAAHINVEFLRINVSGRVNFRTAFGLEAGAPGYEAIKIAVDIQTDAPTKKVTELMEKAFPAAPIPDTIMRPVPINVDIVHHSEKE